MVCTDCFFDRPVPPTRTWSSHRVPDSHHLSRPHWDVSRYTPIPSQVSKPGTRSKDPVATVRKLQYKLMQKKTCAELYFKHLGAFQVSCEEDLADYSNSWQQVSRAFYRLWWELSGKSKSIAFLCANVSTLEWPNEHVVALRGHQNYLKIFFRLPNACTYHGNPSNSCRDILLNITKVNLMVLSQEGTFSENLKNCLRIYMDVVSDQMFKELHPIRTCCVVR